MTQPPPQAGTGGPDYGGWAPPPPQQAPAQPWAVPPGGPPTGQQPWAVPPTGPQYGQQEWLPQPAPPAQPHHRRGLVAAIVAVLVLAGGGVASYFAFADSSTTGGAASPRAAVQNLVTDLNNADLVGLLDDLAPGERDALAAPIRDDIEQLKRLHVLSSDADGSSISGVTFAARNLTYAAKPTVINDHVQTVEVTGGTIDVSADAAKLPFSSQFVEVAGPTGPHGTAHQHVDIAQAERDGGSPVWIATQQVGGRWYPSLFYTIAAEATGNHAPPAADRIPAVGASSPEDAVRQLVADLMRGDVGAALALASPDEMGVLHDYGGLLLRRVPHFGARGVSVTALDLTTTPLSGGAQRVGLRRLAVDTPDGPVSVMVDGSCYQVSAQGQSHRLCASDIVGDMILGGGTPPSQAQQRAFTDLFSALGKFGVVTTQTGGQWYVNPVRTFTDLGGTALSGLQGNDLLELIKLAHP